MEQLNATEVFVPGGQPLHTYVQRQAHRLEERLSLSKQNLCKLVTLTGATKSGKTVLTKRLFSHERVVWLDGGAFDNEEDFWNEVLAQLEGFTSFQKSTSRASDVSVGVEASGQLKIPLVSSTAVGGQTSATRKREVVSTSSRSSGPRPTAVGLLRASRTPLVVDDFHYLQRSIQRDLVRALKPVVFDGIPVILLAIPHRRYDAVRVEREMTGRIESIEVPDWNHAELSQIPRRGFELLNLGVTEELILLLCHEALGSPHLMQEFCRELCLTRALTQSQERLLEVRFTQPEIESVFRKVAAGTSKVIFDRLARGPRSRLDRKARQLRAGGTTDIYGVVLLAIAKIQPEVETLEYDRIRTAVRDLLEEDPPQANEITRVLEKIAEISSDDEASVPVIDWDKEDRRLHITDPFFAFFLKWGDHGIS